MKFGIHYSLGVGMNPSMDDYVRVAVKAEELGYHSAWLGDHVVIPEKIESTYPYTPDGSASFPRRLPFPDTFVVLAALGAHTKTIKLGTSVIVVPYRNPLPVAKAVATVDMATNGRYLFGVGVGWLAEEFEALGEKFSERGSRTREYLQVMKAVWQEEAASFEGKYFSFPDLYALPLPVQKPHPPIIFGGESMPALKRVADLGDGWQPGPVPLETLRERMGQLRELMAERGRDFSQLSISMLGDVKDLQENPDTLAALGELGVQEMVLFMATLDTDKTLAQMEEAANAFMS